MRRILLSACICTLLPFSSSASGNTIILPINTFLADINTSQNLESWSRAAANSKRPVSFPAFKIASVHFLTNDGGQVFGGFGNGDVQFEDPTVTRCQREGYNLTACTIGLPTNICPYNSSYFKSCCTADYKYTSCAYPLTKSAESCGGKYRCYCDASLFPYTGCVSPQVSKTGSGSSCTSEGVTRYSECVCPDVYAESCTGLNQQGKGVGCTKNGETKYTGCECKAGYTLTCSELGPVRSSDYCERSGIRYYNECKTCPNKCSLASCPAGVVCEYEDCSKKYCDIGCAVGYINWCTTPETNCTTLGYTKSISQCPDGYVKCPYNPTSVFCKSDVYTGF